MEPRTAEAPAPKEKVTAQLLSFASERNRRIAQKLNDSPSVTLSAAVMAFELLEPAIQVEMLGKARVAHAEHLRA